jgi:hypothetical protein
MAMSVAGILPAACWNSLIPAPGVLTLDCLTASRDLPGVLDGVLDAIVWNLFLLGVLLIPPSRRPGIPPAAGILSLLASLRVAAYRDAPSQVPQARKCFTTPVQREFGPFKFDQVEHVCFNGFGVRC